MSDFMVRYAKVCAVEPMQPPRDFEVVQGDSGERFKVHLDGGQELIVNRATAQDIMRVLQAANSADSYWWEQGKSDIGSGLETEPEHTRVIDHSKGQ